LFQAEDGIRDLVRSRGLGDVYKRQIIRMRGARCSLAVASVPAGALGSRVSMEFLLAHSLRLAPSALPNTKMTPNWG